MNLESLRENRKGATAVFTVFSRMKESYNNSIFCCFEGDDSKYYFKRIEDFTKYKPDNIVVLNCEGKKEVLRLQSLIKEKEEYNSVKLLYFIDKDFDPPIEEQDAVYETPGYSIENFYTTLDAFIRIIKVEFIYNEMDDAYDKLIQFFKERQKEFHQKTQLLNAWLACQRDRSTKDSTSKLNLNDFNLISIIPVINLDKIEENYNLDTLEKVFPNAVKITLEEIKEKISEFDKFDLQKIFRGKFEIDFLYSFLEAVKIEYNNPTGRFKKKSGVQLNQSKKNMISEFSQYACTSSCLEKYLSNFKYN